MIDPVWTGVVFQRTRHSRHHKASAPEANARKELFYGVMVIGMEPKPTFFDEWMLARGGHEVGKSRSGMGHAETGRRGGRGGGEVKMIRKADRGYGTALQALGI